MNAGDRRVLDVLAFAVLPALRVVLLVPALFGKPPPGLHQLRDFHVFWLAGRAYAHGGAVYPSVAVAAHPPPALDGNLFVYPAPSAAMFAPLGLLPYPLAAVFFGLLSVVALWAALRLLDVRDWRCYGALILWPATPASVLVGTLTPLLLLGAAALWRFRDRPALAVPITVALLVTKLFLWPLAIWLAATRRLLLATVAVGAAVAVSLLAWLPIGGLTEYPRLVRALSLHELGSSFQLVRLVPASAATRLALVEIAAAVAAVALVWACRRLDESSSLALAVGVALLVSPIVWLHYSTLLVLPLALRSPRFSWLWLLPVALWAYPFETDPHQLFAVVVFAVVVILATRPGRGHATRPDTSTSPREPAASPAC